MPPSIHVQNFHFKLIREQPTLESWGHPAPTEEDALLFFARKLGMRLDICVSPASYRLEKYNIDSSGKVLHENILRVSNVKQG